MLVIERSLDKKFEGDQILVIEDSKDDLKAWGGTRCVRASIINNSVLIINGMRYE